MNAGTMGIFPLTFLSNVFVDVNPISLLATASRGLMVGNVHASGIVIVLLVAVGLTAVFAPLTVRLYRRG